LTFSYQNLNFDAPSSFQKDAFEASLVDAAGNPLVVPIVGSHDAFFNISEGLQPVLSPNAQMSGTTVSVDLSHIPAGIQATLELRLVNNDDTATTTSVTITGVSVTPGGLNTLAGAPPAGPGPGTPPPVDFLTLSDVTPSVHASYGQTSFRRSSNTLFADLSLVNAGIFSVGGPVVVALAHLSDPTIHVANADGVTPSGLPYFNFGGALSGSVLGPGQQTVARTLEFLDPKQVQFTYDLVVLAELNGLPVFTSQPNTVGLVGHPYSYQAKASDKDGDSLTYSLLSGPSGMIVNATTGLISWAPGAGDIGNQSVALRVDDGRGGTAEQDYTLSVTQPPPNQPPVFTSTPVVSGQVNTLYQYQATATDADQDSLTFAGASGPQGLNIDPVSGLVTWQPTAGQHGLQPVALTVSDGRGGTATQTYNIDVTQQPGNEPPVITSQPVTQYNLPPAGHAPNGSVNPTNINLTLGPGQTNNQTVSITLPNGRALTLGTVISTNLATPGEQDQYSFTLTSAALLYFDSLTNSNNFSWTLTGPSGTLVANRTFAESDGQFGGANPVTPVPAGPYTLTVSASGKNTGAYSFNLQALSQAQALTPGATVSGTLNPANSTTAYQFSATAGSSYYFAHISDSSGNTYWRLIDPFGNVLYATTLGADGGRLTLTATGTYTVLIEGNIGDTGTSSYSFNVAPITDPTRPLTLGSTVNGTLGAPGELDHYTFNLASPSLLYFDSLTNNGSISWTLTGPPGTVVSNRNFSSSDAQNLSGDPVLSLPAGPYTLTVSGFGQTTGAYSFDLQALSQAQALTLGTAVSGTLNLANSTTAYRFNATTGSTYYFAHISNSSNATYWRLIDPFGNVLFGSFLNNDGGRLTLNATGTYTVLIEGGIADTGTASYSFNVLPVTDPTQPLTLGATVNATLAAPGEQDHYTFNLSAATLLYFDSLTNNRNLQWTLSGPAGTAVSNRVFTNSDGGSSNNPVLPLPAGPYTLTVNTNTPITGPYSFRVLDLSLAQTLTAGTTSGTLSPANSTTTYKLSAHAGDSYNFTHISPTSGNAYWRLIDPFGNVLFSTPLHQDGGQQTLNVSGNYTLLIEGDIGDTGTTSYSFSTQFLGNVPPTSPSGTHMTLGTPVSGSLAVAGQQDHYVFTLSSAALLYFDSLTNNSNLQWTLTGPAGTAVSNRSFNNSDSPNVNNPVLPMPAGTYQLTVFASGTNTGAYSFDLFALSQAQALTPGTAVSGTLNPANSTTAYQFSATAGSSYYFAHLSNSSNSTYWRLIDPFGNVLFANYLNQDGGRLTLNGTGTYTVLIEGYIYDTGTASYSFNVLPITDPTHSLSLGSTVNATLGTPGELDHYTFTLPSASLLYFDSLTNSSSFTWTLTGPAGTAVSNRSFTSSDGSSINADPVLSLPAGPYTLTVLGSGQTTGAYSFDLQALSQAQALTPGTVVSGTLNPANSTTAYQFNATAGSTYYFAHISNSGGNTYWRLIDPFGNVLFGSSFTTDGGRLTLNATGTYTVLIEGYISDTGTASYSFNVAPVTDPTQPLTLGNTVNGTLATRGELDHYTFNLPSAALLYFDSLTNNNYFQWTLTGPGGTAVSNRSFISSDGQGVGNPVLPLPAGPYTLTVSAQGQTTGAYSFRLLPLAQAAALAPGTPVSGTLSPADSTAAYQFTATAGSTYYFAHLSNSSNYTYWRLIDPFGDVLFGSTFSYDGGRLTLKATGIYTVLIEGSINDTGTASYSFNVAPITDPTQALTLGSTVNASLRAPGKLDHYTFTLASASMLYFDSLTNDSNFSWTLTGPAGAAVSNRSFTNSDAVGIANPVLPLPAGPYTLTVSGDQAKTGAYSFNLQALSQAQPLTPGTAVSGTLALANSTNAYQFNAMAGSTYYLAHIASSSYYTYWRLIDPFGNVLFGTPFANDGGRLTLSATGTYTVLIEGYLGDTGTASYSFNVLPVTDSTQALTLGSTVNSTLGTPGELDHYTFNLASGAMLYFDSLTNNNNFSWTLTGPAGTAVSNRSFTSSDGESIFVDPVLPLPPGPYTLTVSASGQTAGAYAFRLLQLGQEPALTPGTAVSGTLAPADSTNVYQFSATAGSTYYFAHISFSSYQTDWRLIDPFGNVLFRNSISNDGGRLTLNATGTYTVLIEGYIGDTGTASYSFNVLPITDPTQPLTVGSTVNATLGTPGELDHYTFNLPSAAQLYFDSLTNNNNFQWTLTGPPGTVVSNRYFTSSDGQGVGNPVLPLPAGPYTLTVFGSGATTGPYSFDLQALSQAQALTPGTPVSGTLSPANSTKAYQFSATVGSTYYLAYLSNSSGNPYWRLIDPFGNVLFGSGFTFDSGRMTLKATGTYTVLIEGNVADTGTDSYSFNVLPVTDTTQSLTVGSTVNGSLGAPGELDHYTFTLPSATLLYFDSLTNNNNFSWTLTGPAGMGVSNRSFTNSDASGIGNPVLSLPAGPYTLTVSGFRQTTGAYSFRVLDLSQAQALTTGTTSSTLSPANSTTAYKLSAHAGDTYFFGHISTSSNDAYWRLIDPFGNIVFGTTFTNDGGQHTLNVTGNYTLLIEGFISDTGTTSYSFGTQFLGNVPPTPPSGTPLTLGTPVNGTLTAPGKQDHYIFTLSPAALLYFDSLTNNSSFQWSLTGPAGAAVSNRYFTSSDGSSMYGDPVLSLPAGAYQLTVSASGGTIGAYSFDLFALSQAKALTPGAAVSSTLNPANSTTAYQFSATAGSSYYFARLSNSSNSTYWRLIDPFGNVLFANSLYQDGGRLTLNATGTYTVLIEGYIGDTGTASYSFNVAPITDTTQALTVGSTVNGTLGVPGELDHYTFNLPSAALLYFDSLTNNGNFQWTLTGPGGTAVSNRGFTSSDGQAIYSDPVLPLPAGPYTLTVSAQGQTTGAYSFDLQALSQAAALTPGTAVSSTLNPANSTTAYQFSATAGSTYYFAHLSNSSNSTYWRLIDPFGNVLFANSLNQDGGRLTLNATGTYTVLIEGGIGDTGTASYSFNVLPITDPTQPLTVGNTVNGTLGAPGELDHYTFNLPSAALLYFDSLTNNNYFQWMLTGPAGTAVSNRPFSSSDGSGVGNPVSSLPAGPYTLTVSAQGQTTGAYSFDLFALSQAQALTPGTAVSSTLNPAKSTTAYQFNATAGSSYYFARLSNSSNNTYWRLIDPFGNVLFGSPLNSDGGRLTLKTTGTYTVLIEGGISDTGTASYSFYVAPITDPMQTLTLGNVVNGTLGAPGELDHYTFTLPSASQLYFDSLTNNNNLFWTLTGPAGTVVSNRSFTASDASAISGDPVLPLPAGPYTLTVSGMGQAVGAYSFRLLNLSSAVPFSTNKLVTSKFTLGNGTDLYQFSGRAGAPYLFESIASIPNAYWRLIDPFGNVVFAGNLGVTEGPLTLSATGPYTLLIEGALATVGSSGYEFRVDEQSVVDVIASDPTAPFVNLTGAVSDVTNPSFNVQFTGDGTTHVFDLQFVAPATQAVLGTIPVSIDAEYLYQVRATDADGDPLTFKLTQAPTGMQIDPATGLITWQPTAAQLGENAVTVRVDDGRGGSDTQSFMVDVVSALPGTLHGTVFNDLNGNGTRDSTGGNPNYTGGPFLPVSVPFPAIGLDPQPGVIVTIGAGGTTTTTFTGVGPYDGADDTYIAVVNQANSGVAVQSLQLSSNQAIFSFDGDGFALGTPTGYETAGTSYSGISSGESGTVNFDDGAGNGLQPGFETYFALEDAPTVVNAMLQQVSTPVTQEPGLPGWTVYLDLNHDGKLDPGDPFTQTDAQGNYTFSNLVPGNYTVAEVGQAGWQQTAPPGRTSNVVVQSGQVTTVPDFGNQFVQNLADHPPAIKTTPPTTGAVGRLYRYGVAVSNPDGDSLTFDLPTSPAGMVVDPQSGVVLWTPTAQETGLQTAILRMRDADGDVILQDLQINVAGVEPPPVITSTPGLSAPIGLQYRYQVEAQVAPGDTLSFRLDQAPTGMVVITTTGLIFWTPTSAQAGVQPVTVTAINGKGAQVSQSFNLQVGPPGSNLAPAISSTPPGSVALGQTYRYAFQASDPDGDALAITLPTAPAGMTIDSSGMITWTPTAAQFGPNAVDVHVDDGQGATIDQSFTVQVVTQPSIHPPSITSTPPGSATVGSMYSYNATGHDPDNTPLIWSLDSAPAGMTVDGMLGTVRWVPTADELGSQKVALRLTNGEGQAFIQTFTVLVQAVNLPPVITSEPQTQIGAGQLYSYAVQASDADGDPLNYSLTQHPSGMTIDPASGMIQWTPTAAQAGTQSVAIQVSDGQGGTATQTWSIVVPATKIAYPPVITSLPSYNATAGQAYTYQVIATDPQGQSLTYSISPAPTGMKIDPVSGLVQWTPANNQAGMQTVQVNVTDQGGLAAHQTYTLDVIVNQPPTITSQPLNSITAGLLYAYDVQATDADGDPLTYTLNTGPTGMTLDAQGRLRWSTGIPNIGTSHVSLSVADNHGATVTQTFDITVGADTQAPQVLLSVTPNPVALGSQVTVVVTATDNVGVTALNLTVGGTHVGLDTNGRAVLTMNTLGSFNVVASASDAAGNVGTANASLSVVSNVPNQVPVISSAAPTSITAGLLYAYDVQATDADGDALTYTLNTGPAGMMLDAQGHLRWSTGIPNIGTAHVSLSVTDNHGATVTQTFDITIQADTQPPQVQVSVNPNPALVGSQVTFVVSATDNVGVTGLGLTVGGNPVTLDANGRGTLTVNATGTFTVVATASDAAGNIGSANASLSVVTNNTNQAPVITSAAPTSITAGLLYTYDVQANDPDGDPLTYTLNTGPAGMTLDAQGHLRWSTGIPNIGTGQVALTVADNHGSSVQESFAIAVLPDTQAPQVQISVTSSSTSLGSQVTFTISATDNVSVAGLGLTVGGNPVTLNANGQATVTMNTAGDISAVATAHDAAGNVDTASDTVSVIDPSVTTPPNVDIATPSAGSTITAPTDVTGTVSDSHLLYYTLSVEPVGGSSFTEFFRGTGNVNNALLGRFDPSTLPNDSYILQLLAKNTGGLESTATVMIDVTGNLKLGNFTDSFTDLTIPVSGIPITVTRTYDSLNATNSGDFGYGWRLGLSNTQLHTSVPLTGLEGDGIYNPFQVGSKVYVTLPGGKREGFTFYPTPAPGLQGALLGIYYPNFEPDPGVTDKLTVAQNDLMLNSDGSVISWGDGLPYNPADDIFGGSYVLTTQAGQSYQIDGNSGALTKITDSNGNSLTINSNGITSSAGAAVTFARDPQGRITAITDPAGDTINYQYDASGNLVTVIDRGGNKTQFVYGAKQPHYLTQIIDPLGHTGIRTNYDDQGRLVSITNGNGNAVQLSYDPTHSSETVLDQLGNPTTYVYDNQGNIISETNALGGTTTNTYDANNNLLTETDPLGHTTTNTYDASGNQLTQTDALGHVTRYGYTSIQLYGGAPGAPPAPIFLPTTTTDALGNTTSNSYDSQGNLLSITDAAGHATSFVYGPSGNPSTITDSAGGKTAFQYDPTGHLTQQTDPLGNVTHYTYDADGNVLTQTTTLTTPTGVHTLVIAFTYDANGHRTSVTDAQGNVTQSQYDAAGNKVADIDPLGRKTKYVYDNVGELTQTIYPDGSSTKNVYDADGHLTATIDELGRQTTLKYDVLGRLIETDYPDGTSTKTVYDAAGEITAKVDELGNRTQYNYDAAGEQLTVTDAQGNVTSTTYDVAGRAKAVTDPLGHVTHFVFDALGRRVETDYADGSKATVTYDAGGRVASRTDQAGVTTSYKYDALGRLTAVIDALGQTTSYAYNEAGDLISQTDASGHVTHYEYDGLGHRTATVLPMGQRSTTSYDAAGEVQSTTDFNGQTISYAYDARGRLITENFPDGTSTTFTYTVDGQRATATDSRGVTSYTYDARDRLLSRTNPDGTVISYTYDAAGNRTSVTTPAGTTSYTFTVLNQIATVTDPSKGVTQYTYDTDGNLVHTSLPNGTSEVRQYDALNRLVYLEYDGPSGVISSYRYTLDPNGNRTKVVEDTGRTTQYAYDALFRLIGETITDPVNGNRTITYTYDAVGNRLTRNDSGEGLTTDTYDANGRLVTETLGSQTAIYAYDKNGNTLSQVKSATDQVFYHWDAQNHMIGADVTDASGTHHTIYTYDADGIRVSATTDGVATRYLIDIVQPNPEVLLEYRPNGAAVVSYVYGNDLIEQDRGGVQSYYQKDGLGSTRALTNANGAVTDRYAFDAFGRIISQTGNTLNSYLFAGQQRDGATGLDYLRARYLNTRSGTFLSKDPAAPKLTNPLTANEYIYANANPVRFADPTGRQGDLISVTVGISVEASLVSFQINFAQAGLRGVARTAKVADAILRPAFILEDVGINLIADDQAPGIDVYEMGRTLEATGYRAIGAVLLRIYAETAQSQLPKVNVKINSSFFEFEGEFQAFEGQYKFKGGGIKKTGGYGNFDAELDALIEQVHTFVETTGIDANTTDMQFSDGIKQITDLAIKVIGKIPKD
jgi:RHS repeat-associated protein